MKKFFFFGILILLAIASYLFFKFSISSDVLALPKQFAVVQATSASQLGTQEDNLGVDIGTQLSDFTVKTVDNQTVTLYQLLSNEKNFVIFYRGGWCPYCNYHIKQLAQAYPLFEKEKIQLILISADEIEGGNLIKDAYHIPFSLISDPLLVAHQAFNVVLQISDLEAFTKKILYDLELENWSKQSHHKIAVPAFFLLDQKGIVKWEHIATDYTIRPSPEQLLSVAKHLPE